MLEGKALKEWEKKYNVETLIRENYHIPYANGVEVVLAPLYYTKTETITKPQKNPYFQNKYGPIKTKKLIVTVPSTYKCSVIGGLLTFTTKTKRIYWLARNKDGFLFKTGYLFDETYHLESVVSYKEALAEYNTILSKKRERKLAYEKRVKDKPVQKKELSSVWVTREDARKAGNCSAGIENFIYTFELNHIGAIRADELLRLRNDHSTRLAVKYAQTHEKGV